MVEPSVEGDGGVGSGGDTRGKFDGLVWCKDLGFHVNGEFSMATVQANKLVEEQSQLESGPLSSLESGPYGTFIGVYDGHGGPETPCFLNNTLFSNLKKFTTEHQEISADVIRKAFLTTDEEFLSLVKQQWFEKPDIASVGSCCLVGIICNGLLYIANVGDSRVVLGRAEKAARGVTAIQLSIEHTAANESVRDELRSLQPQDLNIVVWVRGVWRVKGIIKVGGGRFSVELVEVHKLAWTPRLLKKKEISRSIGDAYLKREEFNRVPPLSAKLLWYEPSKPILSAEPSIFIHRLTSKDQFLIFGSDGLWENLSNQEAVDIVHNQPRNGIARRLIKAALRVAAKKRELSYFDLKMIPQSKKRYFHDDITVVVVFLDPCSMNRSSSHSPILSIRGGGGMSASP